MEYLLMGLIEDRFEIYAWVNVREIQILNAWLAS